MAPFNTTKSETKKNKLNNSIIKSSFNWTMDPLVKELMVEKANIIKFGIRVKEIDKNYELNNNCDLDNGVFNKFA